MCISRLNAEGYQDPTAYEALARIWEVEKTKAFRPLVFICCPFAGDTETNVRNARQYCRFAVGQNCIPIAPHLLFTQFLDDMDEDDRGLGLFFSAVLLGKCAEVWVFGDERTAGMKSEINKAKNRNMPIRYFDCSCREVEKT